MIQMFLNTIPATWSQHYMYPVAFCILHPATMYWTDSEASLHSLDLSGMIDPGLLCSWPVPKLPLVPLCCLSDQSSLATDRTSWYQLLLQPVCSTCHAGAYPSMMVPPLLCWVSAACGIIFAVHHWRLSSWCTHGSLLFCSEAHFPLSVLDLESNALCIVRSFLVLISVAHNFSIGQVIIPAGYLITDRAYVLMALTLFFPFS